MKKAFRKTLLALFLGTASLATFAGAVSSSNSNNLSIEVNADSSDYYTGISGTATGTTLLGQLQSLNKSKRSKTVGYGAMGTSASGAFKYTDYDPNYTTTDSTGQIYGTKILSFYSGTSCTGFNREHTWPKSHGGGTVDGDIHMTRPTISSENGSRGNSFFVEGMNSSSSGWDPAMESFGDETYRGDAARIIFYCCVANSQLSLLDVNSHSTSKNNPDYKMGKLSDLLKWNLEYPVTQREQNRNAGAQYLQGNRNPFIDHPEFACKIWGDTNETTRGICGNVTKPSSVTVNPNSATIAVGGSINLTATSDTGSSSFIWSSDKTTIATVDSTGKVTAKAQGTAVIKAASSLDADVYGTCTVTVKSVSSISLSGKPNKTEYYNGDTFEPAGLTVTATYSDGSVASVNNSVCSWYDGSHTSSQTLSTGTTSIFCKFGSASATYNGITVTDRPASQYYTLVNNINNLNAGDSVILASKDNNVVAGEFNDKYLSSVSNKNFESNYITDIGDAEEFTLGGSSTSGWTFTDSDGHKLGATSAKNLSISGGTQTWNISFKDDNAVVASTSASYGTIQYNSQSPRFLNYTSSQSPIQIYSKGVVPTPTPTGEVTGISVSPGETKVDVGQTVQLTATVTGTGSFDKTVTWSSSNNELASVDQNGLVTASKPGEVYITATSSNPNKYAICYIVVRQNPTPASTESYQINFKNFDKDDTQELEQSNGFVTMIDSGKDYVNNFTNFARCYRSKQGLKMGSKSGSGYFTMNLKEAGQGNISTIKISAKAYNDEQTKMYVKTNFDSTGKEVELSTTLSTYELAFDGSVTSITIGTSKARAFLKGIEVVKVTGSTGEVSVSIDQGESLSVAAGEIGKLTYTFTGDSKTINAIYWVSTDEDVIVVDEEGNFLAGDAGTADVAIYVYANNYASFYNDYLTITVIASEEDDDVTVVVTFVETYMHMNDYNDNLGYCKDSEHHFYQDAKAAYNALSDSQKFIFNHDDQFIAPLERLIAWANANGETIDLVTMSLVNNKREPIMTSHYNILPYIIIGSSLMAISLFLLKKKRK